MRGANELKACGEWHPRGCLKADGVGVVVEKQNSAAEQLY